MKKTATSIGHKVQENERLYDDSLEETKQNVDRMETGLNKFKTQEVIKLGRILDKTSLVERTHISGKLKRDLKGYIHRSTVYEACLDEWKDMKYNMNPKGINKSRYQFKDPDKELTKWEQHLIESGEVDLKRDEHIDYLLEYFTGKTIRQQSTIRNNTSKGMDWRTTLENESRDNIRNILKRLSKDDMKSLLLDIRTVNRILSLVGDMIYEEQEIREKQDKILTK